MNQYSVRPEVDEDGHTTWTVFLCQPTDDTGKSFNEWLMCWCESKKDAEEIRSALEYVDKENIEGF